MHCRFGPPVCIDCHTKLTHISSFHIVAKFYTPSLTLGLVTLPLAKTFSNCDTWEADLVSICTSVFASLELLPLPCKKPELAAEAAK